MPLKLDDTQSAVISIDSGKHYLQAPPGAGKTAILTERLKHALNESKYKQIACLTFTTRAADEMRSRASSVVDLQTSSSRLFIGNFHAFCIHHLHRSKTVGRAVRYFALLNDDFYEPILERASLMEVRTELNDIPRAYTELVDSAFSKIINIASQYNRRLPSLSHVFKQVYIHMLAVDLLPTKPLRALACEQLSLKLQDYLLAIVLKQEFVVQSSEELAIISWSLYNNFRQLKSLTNSLDFDDILILALKDLVNYPKPIGFIQVDEVQDLSPYQWEIINAISNEQSHIFAVGDDQQSIYSFMGADIRHLQVRVKNYSHHYLTNNYRSHPNIIHLLNLYRMHNWQLEPINSIGSIGEDPQEVKGDSPSLLLGFANKQTEIIGVSRAVAKILREPKRSIGVLLSTNAQCDDYYNQLEGITSGIFRVSQNDLMQRPFIQDWFSALKILSGTHNYHDWWRLVYRFGRITDNSLTKNQTLNFCYQLQEFGFSVHDLLFSVNNLDDVQNLKLEERIEKSNINQCISAFNGRGVVIFDTETTGLDFENAAIIQLAAIRVADGKILDVFDQYVNINLDQDETLKTAFFESQAIHHISESDLQNGNEFQQVAQEFFEFVGESPVIAHNLMFDLTMLRMNVSRENSPELKKNYHSFRRNVMFDSLALSRQLYPSLTSHKLGDLLEQFNLAGINSHNALDDVKATASLVKHLFEEMDSRLPSLNQLIADHEKLYEGMAYCLPMMFEQLIEVAEEKSHIQLSDTLASYLKFAQDYAVYDAETIRTNTDEVNFKLIPWLDKKGYFGLFNYLLDNKKPKTERLLTLKESDLIDKDIHRLVISTVHRAKGLEFETVILPQVTDNSYPMWIPNNVGEIERQARINESCRLLYVGLSRPKNKLIVTFHHMAGSYSRDISPFIIGMVDAFSWVNLNVDV